MTLEEYFEFDKNAEGNFEYFDGEVLGISGVSPNHARIERNLTLKLSPRETLHLNALELEINVDDLYRSIDMTTPSDE